MSGRSQSIRFVSGRIYRDASDRIPADTLVTQNGAIHFVGARDEAPSTDVTVDLRSVKTLMTVVRGTIQHDALGSQHFKVAEVIN